MSYEILSGHRRCVIVAMIYEGFMPSQDLPLCFSIPLFTAGIVAAR